MQFDRTGMHIPMSSFLSRCVHLGLLTYVTLIRGRIVNSELQDLNDDTFLVDLAMSIDFEVKD